MANIPLSQRAEDQTGARLWMKDFAARPQPMGFLTASRAAQGGLGLRTRWEISSKPSGPKAQWHISQRATQAEVHGDMFLRTIRIEGSVGYIPSNRPDRRLNAKYPRERVGPSARWEISAHYSGRWVDGIYPRALLGSRVRWEISPPGSDREFAARFPCGTWSRAQRSAHTSPEVGVFPSPGRRSPTGIVPGGQAASAQFTTTLSHRRLTSRRDSGCLRWLAKGTPRPVVTHHEPDRSRAA